MSTQNLHSVDEKSISWDIVDTAIIILDLSLSFFATWEEAGRSRALHGLTFLSSKLATLPRWAGNEFAFSYEQHDESIIYLANRNFTNSRCRKSISVDSRSFGISRNSILQANINNRLTARTHCTFSDSCPPISCI